MLTVKRLGVCLAAVAVVQSGCVTAADRLGRLRDQPLFSTSSASTTVSPAASRCTVPNGINPGDADEVADAAADTLACHDTRSDDSPLDATRRAAQWLDPAIVPEPGAQIRTDATWTDWARHRAWTPTRVERIDLQTPPDYTAPRIDLARQTTSTPTDASGAPVAPAQTTQWILTLDKRAGVWRVTMIQEM